MEQTQIVIEEYKVIWTYYQKSIDERSHLFQWYFRIVTFPAALIGVATILRTETGIEVSTYAISGLLFVIYLAGITLHITYAMQSSNAKKMEIALIKLREYLRLKEPDLEDILIFDKLRKDVKTPKLFGTIKFWRGLIFSIINSAIISGGIGLLIDVKYWYVIIIVYSCSLLLHNFLYSKMFSSYRYVPPEGT